MIGGLVSCSRASNAFPALFENQTPNLWVTSLTNHGFHKNIKQHNIDNNRKCFLKGKSAE